jgi:hypothetical protein
MASDERTYIMVRAAGACARRASAALRRAALLFRH